uniref:MsrB domain-containing protein n=1 Tax=Hanusia phi TaxID=3032 RepID=A0A7S0HVB0_9CRYP
MSDSDWMKILSSNEFECLRLGKLEFPFASGKHNETRAGIYLCAGCGAVLFHSKFRFNAGIGYLSFFNAFPYGIEVVSKPFSHPICKRVQCRICGSYHGELWADGFLFDGCPVDTRFCINGCGVIFMPAE